MNMSDWSEEQLRAALMVALEALERIRASDPGPAHHIAKSALAEIQEDQP